MTPIPAFISRSHLSIEMSTAIGLPFLSMKAASSSSDSFVMAFEGLTMQEVYIL
ncbi:hypothetical protein [Rothia sp. P7208]|uniref:hypothetical protein n=1 Tax=Rothia sp. P7208 TaxID=3402660 RepID=UPI003AD204C9